MPKKMYIIIIAFFVHALGWAQALDESEKKSLEQKIVGIWQTKATHRKGIEYSILDYKSCFCLKHRCENNTSYNKKSFIPFSSRFTFNEDNTFSIAHFITLAPKSPCRYTYNGGTWEIFDKKTIRITSPLTIFYTATVNGKPWTGNEVYEDITRNADLSFDENGNIAQICIREKSTNKKCTEVKFSIYPACIIDSNNRLIDVNNRLETFEPFFEKTLQNLLFTKSCWYPPTDISSLLLSTKNSAIGLLNLYCNLSINDNKFILEAFDHDKSKKMLWSTGGEVNLWQDGTGAIRIAFKFTDEPKITDLLEVDGPFSKEELVHRINRIILSEKVCYFEPYSCSSHRISYLYDLFEEFPERINEIKRLNLPRFHQINSTLSTYDKNLQAEQKKHSERQTENQKLMQKLNNKHDLVAAVKNKESSGLCIHLIPLIEEHNNILELTKIEPEALNYAIKEVLGKKESNDNPVVAKKKVKKKRKKKKKKKIIQETHVVEAPKIEEVPQISRPAIVAEAAITAATLAQNWTGELVLDKPTRKGLSRISINLYLAENGEGILQSSLVNNAGEKEIQSLAISWTYKNQGSLSQLHIKALNDAIIMFDQSFRLPEKLRIEPRSKINHLLLSGEYKSSEFSWELRPTIQEVDVAEIEQYHHLSKKEKTQKDPKRLETLMAFIAGNVERVRTFRNTDRQIIDDSKTPQPKEEIPDFKVIDDIKSPAFSPYVGKWTGIIYIDRKNVSKPLFAVNFEIGRENKFEIRDLLTKDILYSDTIGSGVLEDNKQLFLGFRTKELAFSPELFSPQELPNKFEIIAGILVGNKNDFSIHALKTSQSDSSGLNINHLIGIWDDQYHHEQNVHLELFADFTGQMTIIGKDAATKINHFSWNIEKNNDETYIRFLDNKLAKISVANHTDLITYSIDFLDSPDSLSYLRLERCVSLREEESVNSIIASNDKPVIDRSEHLEIASFGVDLDYPDKKLIKRNGFDILYSKEKKVPLAVSYKLKRDYLQQKVNRLPREAFMTDPFLQPDECAENKDYYKSGWDRGHMAPSSHMLRNLGVQQESFYLSNIVPQNHHLNAGTWAYLEILGQYFAKIYKDIQIITGPIYMPGKSVLTIGDNKVAVPHAFYKIFLYKAGKDIHVLPFILPNEPLDEEENISKYLTSIAEIEKNTGLEFLFNLNSQALHSLKNSQPTMW